MATGLMGGTFDPIHLAHLVVAEAALEDLALERLVFMPSGGPPHKPGRHVSAIEDRLTMIRLAVADNPRLEVSDLEARRPLPSYTVDTIREFRRSLGEDEELFFIMGADSLTQFLTWKDPLDLLSSCEFAVFPRPGVRTDDADPRILAKARLLDAPMLDISSSDIRGRVRSGRTIRYLVPPEVSAYISEKKLYS